MGVFDDIEVESGVDLPDPPPTRQFQTKSLAHIGGRRASRRDD